MSNEAEERLRKLRERKTVAIAAAVENYVFRPLPTWGDVDFLLSLIDSQAATKPDCWPDMAAINREYTATQMRDRCVEKVKAMAEQWRQEASNAGRMFSDKTNIATQIATALESLALDHVEQEKQS